MKTVTLLGGVGLLLATASLPALSAEFRFTGTARTDNGTVLYDERHRVEGRCEGGQFRPEVHAVAYHRPDQAEPFATKDLDYSRSVIRPRVDFAQPDFNERMEISYPKPQTLVINWDTPGANTGTETFEVPFTDQTVVDAGFANFIRENWDSVVSGQSVEFRFLGPTRGEHYGFVLEPVSNDRIDADYVVQIRPTGMVLRFLVDPIVLGYSESGALSDYLGLTNIRRNQDENYNAHIKYTVSASPECELTP